MELLCQRNGVTKAFKGKGDVARLARQAGAWMEEILREMGQLARASRAAAAGGFHYLNLHRRPAREGHSYRLRWRDPLHRHVRWPQVAQDLGRLPLGLHGAYREMNRTACALNALYSLYRAERTALARLLRDYEAEAEASQFAGPALPRRAVVPQATRITERTST